MFYLALFVMHVSAEQWYCLLALGSAFAFIPLQDTWDCAASSDT